MNSVSLFLAIVVLVMKQRTAENNIYKFSQKSIDLLIMISAEKRLESLQQQSSNIKAVNPQKYKL